MHHSIQLSLRNNKRISKLSKAFFCSALTLGVLTACSPAKQGDSSTENAVVASTTAPKTENNSYLHRNIQDEVFYFVMPDRFHNAIKDNDNGDPARPISYGGLDTASKWAFHGGDIAGVEAKLDYIESLGVSAIWMTPILRNKAIQNDGFAHHGYWVVDFTEIDPHFGSNDDLKSLIASAHERGIKVFFDIITNHTADVIKYEECHQPNGDFLKPEQKGCEFISTQALAEGESYTPFLLENEKNAKVPAWLNDPKYYNNQGDSFWQGESAIKGDFVGLDDIDTSQTEVIEGLTEVFKDLVTEFKPDGFRIDTVKHVDIEFWQSFSPALMAHAKSVGIPQFFMFGEVFDGNPAGLSKFTTTGKLPSVLDFSFAFNARDVLLNNKPVSQLSNLFDNDDYYRDHDSTPNDLLNFLGNHDMGRWGHFIQNDLPNISEQEQLRRSKLGHALMYFSRGIPVVYYGDEQGFSGDGGDVDARENMDPSLVDVYNDNKLIGTNATTAVSNFDTTHPLYTFISELADTRQAHKPLRRGDHINRLVDDNKQVYAFSRINMTTTGKRVDYLSAFNFSNEPQTISLDTHNLSYTQVDAGELSGQADIGKTNVGFILEPLSFAVVRSDEITPSTITGIAMQTPYAENDRHFVPFTLAFQNPQHLNLARINIYDTSNSEKTLLAFDTTSPYRLVLTEQQFAQLTSIEVVVDNLAGQTLRETFTLAK
ncbi:MAG: alpha-amylase family glycosyl hydrolase [Glaciecola sp.]